MKVDWRGFELHPDTPLEGIELTEKFGPRVHAMHERLQQFAADMGVHDLHPRMRSPNTRAALAIAEYAREQGKLEAFRDAAMDAHWQRGMDLGKREDLRKVAEQAGLNADEAVSAADDPKYLSRVDALRDEASGWGVSGIPTFFFGDGDKTIKVVGCQPWEIIERAATLAGAQKK